MPSPQSWWPQNSLSGAEGWGFLGELLAFMSCWQAEETRVEGQWEVAAVAICVPAWKEVETGRGQALTLRPLIGRGHTWW